MILKYSFLKVNKKQNFLSTEKLCSPITNSKPYCPTNNTTPTLVSKVKKPIGGGK